MKNPTNTGFDQHYNAQMAVDQQSLLIVGYAVSNHPNDQAEVAPTLEAIPAELGTPAAAALDTGYFSAANIRALDARGIDAYIATGRTAHHQGWQAYLGDLPSTPPPEEASAKEKMAYKLHTAVGHAIYRRRKCTIEPVFGCLKEVLGFRQFSLRGLAAVTAEWCLLCVARNLKRVHALLLAQGTTVLSMALSAAAVRAPRGLEALVRLRQWTAVLLSATCQSLRGGVSLFSIWRPCLGHHMFSPTSC